MSRFLGIDVGTSGCKVLLVDEAGALIQSASAEYPLSTPQPLWAEQAPADWWRGVVRCLESIGDDKPTAIGLTGQMHGSVFLDENNAVLRPAILWNDQRTTAECAEIEAAVGKERIREITGNPPLTGFQLPKILWLRNHEPETFARVRKVLLPKDYIRFLLSGVFATDVSDASGVGALDLKTRTWSDEVLQKVGLDKELFPPVLESDPVTGETMGGVSMLQAGIPIVAGGGDQAASGVGVGSVVPGVVSVSLGTSGVVFSQLPGLSHDPTGAIHAFCDASRGWHVMSVMLSCGGAVQWLRNSVYPELAFKEIDGLAAQAQLGSEGLTFLPYLAGERSPLNDPYAVGTWHGLTLRTGRRELCRSVLEGVSFGLRDGYEALRRAGASGSELRVSSGGAKSRFWVQLLADIFDLPCALLGQDEGPAYGAALLAGVGCGVFRSTVDAADRCVHLRERVLPSGADYGAAYARYRALYPALKGLHG